LWATELRREEKAHLGAQVDEMLDLEQPPEELPAVQEVESHVRNRRAQWVSMNQEKRDLYKLGKTQTFTQHPAEEIKIRDLIMSMECLHVPHTYYAYPACWANQSVHREPSELDMRKHCCHAHNIQAYQCHDPITLTLKQMVGQDVMLAADAEANGETERIIVRGNYQHCYYKGCQHKAQNGVGMRGHLETAHHKHNPLDMGPWDIMLEYLAQDPDATIADLIGVKKRLFADIRDAAMLESLTRL
jgi:hypothetical protein